MDILGGGHSPAIAIKVQILSTVGSIAQPYSVDGSSDASFRCHRERKCAENYDK